METKIFVMAWLEPSYDPDARIVSLEDINEENGFDAAEISRVNELEINGQFSPEHDADVIIIRLR